MVEVPKDVAVGEDSRAGRRVRGPLEWDKAMVAGLAQEQGVCVRPLARRLVDRVTGEASTVVLPCGSTQESRCPTCAKRARVLRMHQCAEGWHRMDELPDADLEPGHDLCSDELDDADTDGDGSSRVVRSTRRELLLTGSTQYTGSSWGDNGNALEDRALKHRASRSTRRVPVTHGHSGSTVATADHSVWRRKICGVSLVTQI